MGVRRVGRTGGCTGTSRWLETFLLGVGAGVQEPGRTVVKWISNRWSHNIDGVTKTQIQLPDELYRDLKRFAAEREWSLAETFRRGAELLLELHPRGPVGRSFPWTPPKSEDVGWQGLSAKQLREVAFEDQAPIRLGRIAWGR